MNTYEMRIDQLNFNTTETYNNIAAFSIGHESCIIKFFKVIRNQALLEFIKNQYKLGKQIRIITPFVPEQHLEEIKNLIPQLCQEEYFQNSVIIINDLGLMSYIHRIEPMRQMCLGRNLLACFDHAPWGHKIYESEPPHIQKVIAQVSFYDDEKMDFFKQYHITEIEANLTKGSTDSLKEIQKAGFKVNIYQSSFLYGIQRSCYIRRYNTDQTCNGTECDSSEQLELDKLWCGAGFYQIEENIEFPSPLYLRGNQIYGKTQNILCDWADRIIVSPESYNVQGGKK